MIDASIESPCYKRGIASDKGLKIEKKGALLINPSKNKAIMYKSTLLSE